MSLTGGPAHPSGFQGGKMDQGQEWRVQGALSPLREPASRGQGHGPCCVIFCFFPGTSVDLNLALIKHSHHKFETGVRRDSVGRREAFSGMWSKCGVLQTKCTGFGRRLRPLLTLDQRGSKSAPQVHKLRSCRTLGFSLLPRVLGRGNGRLVVCWLMHMRRLG